jgi:hypothetical protein
MLALVSTPDAVDPLPDQLGWDHRGYLLRAWSALRDSAFEDAIGQIRRERGDGDHATLVLAWARLLAAALARAGAGPDFDAFVAAHPELLDPRLVLRHYSPQRLASARARREFVLPDRLPLPAVAHGAKVRNPSALRQVGEPAAMESTPRSNGAHPTQRTRT